MYTARFLVPGWGGLPNPPLDAEPPDADLLPTVNRETGVETLPCPKLRLRAVINHPNVTTELRYQYLKLCFIKLTFK